MVAAVADFPREQLKRLGAYIRDQRTQARLSLRQLSELANVSNPYLSQIERGLHAPSVRVLKAIATALDVSADVLLAEAGLLERAAGRSTAAAGGGQRATADRADDPGAVERAISADGRLTPEQKAALLQVYRSYVSAAPVAGPAAGGG